jgi:hypothetical protein
MLDVGYENPPHSVLERGSVQLAVVPTKEDTGTGVLKVEQAVEKLSTPSKRTSQQTGKNFIILAIERR